MEIQRRYRRSGTKGEKAENKAAGFCNYDRVRQDTLGYVWRCWELLGDARG